MADYYHYGARNYERQTFEYGNGNQYYSGGYGTSWFVDNRALHRAEVQSPYRSSLEYSPSSYQPPRQDVLRLKLTICCEEGKRKLEKSLMEMQGVYEVRIDGWTDAMVTVVGTAPPRNVLRKARKHMKNAEFWSDTHIYSANNYHHSSHGHR